MAPVLFLAIMVMMIAIFGKREALFYNWAAAITLNEENIITIIIVIKSVTNVAHSLIDMLF